MDFFSILIRISLNWIDPSRWDFVLVVIYFLLPNRLRSLLSQLMWNRNSNGTTDESNGKLWSGGGGGKAICFLLFRNTVDAAYCGHQRTRRSIRDNFWNATTADVNRVLNLVLPLSLSSSFWCRLSLSLSLSLGLSVLFIYYFVRVFLFSFDRLGISLSLSLSLPPPLLSVFLSFFLSFLPPSIGVRVWPEHFDPTDPKRNGRSVRLVILTRTPFFFHLISFAFSTRKPKKNNTVRVCSDLAFLIEMSFIHLSIEEVVECNCWTLSDFFFAGTRNGE